MIGYVILAIVAILVLGLAFKLVKIAIILALVAGGVVLITNMLGRKRIK